MVGALLEIWGCHYDKTREPPWRAMEMRTPLVAGATTLPPVQGALWVLSIVLHGSTGEYREAYSVPRMGESPAKPNKGEPPKVANSAECSARLRSRRVIP